MSTPVVKQLVLKDWYFNRGLLGLFLVGGLIALGISSVTHGFVQVMAVVLFMAASSAVMFMPIWTVIAERSQQNLPFIMSLPVSIRNYTTAKVLGTILPALVLWLAMIAAYVTFAIVYEPARAGSIPITLVTFGMILAILCINLGVALVTESEKSGILITIFCNICFWFFWSFASQSSFVAPDLASPKIVWRPEILWLLAGDVAVIASSLALTFYLQSRKTDFL